MNTEPTMSQFANETSCLKARVEYFKKIAQESEEKLKAFEWQPIETAPQDGTFVLVWNSHGVNEVYWDEDEDCWCHDIDAGSIFTLRGSHPTHWMPLPKPPKP